MKYSIEGLVKSRTIRSTQIINKKDSGKAIIVNYLDGTQDVFELNNENLEQIRKISESQGKKFILQDSKNLRTRKLAMNINLFVFGVMVVVSALSIPAIVTLNGVVLFNIIEWIITLLLGLMSIVSTLNVKSKKKYIKKYQLYFEQVKDKLNDYNKILEKEKQLTKKKNNDSVKLDSVLDLDNVSLKQVESINEKVDRYYKVDREKVKKLENPSLY